MQTSHYDKEYTKVQYDRYQGFPFAEAMWSIRTSLVRTRYVSWEYDLSHKIKEHLPLHTALLKHCYNTKDGDIGIKKVFDGYTAI